MSPNDEPLPRPGLAILPQRSRAGIGPWIGPHVLLIVLCVPFLWHAFWTQVYFEPTTDALTEAHIHSPEVRGALIGIAAAVIGAVVQGVVRASTRQRAVILGATLALVAASQAIGFAVAGGRAPAAAQIRDQVYSVPAPAGATPLPLDAYDRDVPSDLPSVSRKWQVGNSFLRTDSVTADAAIARTCTALRAVASPTDGWTQIASYANYCSFNRTTQRVRLELSASLTQGDVGLNQRETVTVYLRGSVVDPG